MSAKTRRPAPVATSFGDKLGVPGAASMSRQTSSSSHTSTTADINPRHASSTYPAPPSASTPDTDSWVTKLRAEIREREKPNRDIRFAEVDEKYREARAKIERDPYDFEGRISRLEDYTRRKRAEVVEHFRMVEEDEVNFAKALRASSGEGGVNLEEDEDMVRTQKEILEQIELQKKSGLASKVEVSPTASSYPHPSGGVAPQARRVPSAQSVTSKRSSDPAPPRRASATESLTSDLFSSKGTNDYWESGSPEMYDEDGMLDPVNEEHSDAEDFRDYSRHDRFDHGDGSDSDEDYGLQTNDSDDGASMVSAFLHNAEQQMAPKSSAKPIGGRHAERTRSASIGKTPPSFAQYGMYPSSTTTPVRHQSSRGNLNHQVWKPASSDQMRSGAGMASRPIPIPSQQASQTASFPKRQPSMNMMEQGRQRQGSRDADTLWEDEGVRARTRSGSTSGAAMFSASALPGTSASPRSSSASGAAGQAPTTTPRRWTPADTQQRTPAPPVSSNIHANGGAPSGSPAGILRQRNNSETSSGLGGRSASPARRPSLSNVHSQAPHTPSPKPSSSMAIPSGISNMRRISTESPPSNSTAPVNIPARATAGSRASASSFSSSPFVPPPSSSLSTSHRSASPPPRFIRLEHLPTELVEPEPVNVATSSIGFGLSAGAGKGKSLSFNMRATGRKEEDWDAGAKGAGQRTPNGSRPPSALSGKMAQEKEREASKGKEKEVAVPEDREEDEEGEAPKMLSKAAARRMKGRKKSGQDALPVPASTTQEESQPPVLEETTPPSTAAAEAQTQLISELEARVTELRAEIAALHTSHASERRNLEEQTNALRTSLESQLASVTSAHTQAETKISTLLAQIDEQKEKEREREKKLKEEAAALKKAHKELEKTQRELEKAKDREAEARKEVDEQKRLRKEVEERVKKAEEERRKAEETALKLRRELEAERKKAEEAEMKASEEAVKRQEEALKRESEEAERRTREEMEKKQRAVEEKKADLERRRKEKEAESMRREMEERETALRRREESLERKEEEWARRVEEEEMRRAAEEEERKRRQEAAIEEEEEMEVDDGDDDNDDDADEEDGEDVDDSEAERAEAARIEAQKLEEVTHRQRMEREKAFRHRREDSERRRRDIQRELEANREREDKNRREAAEVERIRRHEREQRERTSRRYEPQPQPPPQPVHEPVGEEEDLLMDDKTVEEQKRALEFYEMQQQRKNLKDAKSSSAGASYAKGWNNTHFPGRATSSSSNAPSNVSQRSTTSNTSTSTAASDFSRASGTSSATSWSGSSSSGGTARPTPTPKTTGSWKPPPAAASSGSGTAYAAGMGMGASPGSYTNSSPLSEAEWARRQEENARKQQEAFMRENARIEQEKAARAAAAAMNASGGRAAVAQLWANYESAWATLKDRPALFFATMPWPVLKPPSDPDMLTANAISAFVLSTAHSQGKSNRDRIKDQLMRWHPDKFESKWMGKVTEAEKDVVRRGAGAVVRGLNELMARESTSF